MGNTFEIRNMTLQDVSQVTKVGIECFSIPWSEKAFENELEKDGAITLVAVYENEVVGFVNGQLVLDEMYINNIAITQLKRSLGIGESLLKEFENAVKEKARFITLEVRVSNESAINLYKKAGYKTVGIRKNFYEKPTENAKIMSKYSNK